MATDFTTTSTDEVAFVRFFGGPDRGACFEFGTVTNFEAVCRAADQGEQFVPCGAPMDTDPEFTRAGLERAVVEGRVTFGEFPVTVEAFSDAAFRFTTEQ